MKLAETWHCNRVRKTPGGKNLDIHHVPQLFGCNFKRLIARQTQCYLLGWVPQGIQRRAVILYTLTAEVNDSITTSNTRCTQRNNGTALGSSVRYVSADTISVYIIVTNKLFISILFFLTLCPNQTWHHVCHAAKSQPMRTHLKLFSLYWRNFPLFVRCCLAIDGNTEWGSALIFIYSA